MTAQVLELPATTPKPQIRCPHCAADTELRGGPTFSTPIGVRRFRTCATCRRPYTTLEHVATYYHEALLAVPVGTPPWALALCEWVARWAARIGGAR